VNTDKITDEDNLISVQKVDTRDLELIYNRKPDLDMRERLIARDTKYTTHGKDIMICKKEDNSYIIFISPQKGEKIAIECRDIDELDSIFEKVVLNYQIALMKGFPLTFTSKSRDRMEVGITDIHGRFQNRAKENDCDYEIGLILNNLRSIFGLPEDPEIASKYTREDAINGRIDLDKKLGLSGMYEEGAPTNTMGYEEYVPIDFYTQEKRLRYKHVLENLTKDQRRIIKGSFKRILKLYEIKEKAPTSYAISTVEDLSINGRKLYRTRDALEILTEAAKVKGKKNVFDFEKAGIDSTIQNYLLEFLYGYRFILSEDQTKILENFKYIGFDDINSFLRGTLDINKALTSEKLGHVVNDIIRIHSIARSIPKRDFDIVIRRIGAGISKDNSVGSENKYDSFVSFATNGGTRMGVSYDSYNQYERLLRSDELAIPMDLICYAIWPDRESECEMLVMPFAYSVEECVQKMNCNHILMGNIRNIDILQVLKARVEETRKKYGIARREKAFKKYPKVLEDSEMARRGYDEQKLEMQQLDFIDAMHLLKIDDEFEEFLNMDNYIQEDNNQYRKSTLHGVNHTRRVAFNARMLANIDGLSEEDKKVLLAAAMFHDIGRVNDDEDQEHGSYSVKKIKARNLLSEFSEEDQELICFLIYEHSLPKRKNKEDLSQLPPSIKERYTRLLKYLKDADKLDRVRLGKYDGLTVSRLELPTSQRLVKLAYQSNLYFESYMEYENTCRVHDMAKHLEDRVTEEIEHSDGEQIGLEKITFYDDIPTKEELIRDVITKKSPYEQVIDATKSTINTDSMMDVVEEVVRKYKNSKDYGERA